MKAKLIVVGGDAKAAEINLKLPTIIGRGREAPLTLPHPLVSRQHCELFESNGQLVVRDLGSLNGTFINNERITESVLPNGELLTIGTVTFRAVYDDTAPAKSAIKPPPKPAKAGKNEKTIGPPSDPTVNVDLPKVNVAPASKTPAAPKAAVPAKPKTNDTSEIATQAAGKSGKGNKDETLRVPLAKGTPPTAATPPKKKWTESSEATPDFASVSDPDEEFELGEDESLNEPAAQPDLDLTIQPNKPLAGSAKGKPADDEFDVDELDFDTPSTMNLVAPPPAKPEPTDAGDLTTNFNPKKLAEDEKARKLAKEQASQSAKGAPPAKAPHVKAAPPAKAPPAKAPAAKTPVVVAPPVKEPGKGEPPAKAVFTKEEDEDLESFFKSLGMN